VKLQALSGRANMALFVGRPLRQPVYWQGPMALASPEALAAAIAAFQRGEFGRIEL
jgi:redox-sensitive bicupin YhaK (pirin superfamily)